MYSRSTCSERWSALPRRTSSSARPCCAVCTFRSCLTASTLCFLLISTSPPSAELSGAPIFVLTGAIVAPGQVDATRCIAYWTIEHRGIIPRDLRAQIGDWIFGCDICQDVCPWNRRAHYADPEIWRPRADIARPDLMAWLVMTDADLRAHLIGTPLTRPGPQGIRRNVIIALANLDHQPARPILEALAVDHDDPVIRATAAWAAHRLGSATALARAAEDPDPSVRQEAR